MSLAAHSLRAVKLALNKAAGRGLKANIDITLAFVSLCRMVKMASSKARGEREPETYPSGTLRIPSSRERRWKAFSPSCYRRRAITAKHTNKLLIAWARIPGNKLPVFS